jgi:RNA polymerase sigma factor (sigma-70 family)
MWRLNDEALVVLAQECGFLPGRQELLVRYYQWMRRRIAIQARLRALTPADCEDAQGEGVSAILEAIACYDTGQIGKRCGRSFRSFLAAVVEARFRDFTRKLYRQRRRYRTVSFLVETSARPGLQAARQPHAAIMADGECPHQTAVRQEEISCLQATLKELEPAMRRLWDQLACGHSLSEIAGKWRVPYDRVRRRRCKLLTEIGARMQAASRRKP